MDETALLDSVYAERNQCISLIVRMAQALNLPVGMLPGQDEYWPLVFVELP